jgi:hypothetical protein
LRVVAEAGSVCRSASLGAAKLATTHHVSLKCHTPRHYYYHFSVLLIVNGGLNTNLVTFGVEPAMGGNCLQVFMREMLTGRNFAATG